MLLIEIPSERVLALVARVVSPDVVICELVATPVMQKYHRHERGDFVPCERVRTDLETVWRAFKPVPRAEPTPAPKTRKKRARN